MVMKEDAAKEDQAILSVVSNTGTAMMRCKEREDHQNRKTRKK